MNHKCGKVEFMRFLFCIIIILFHCYRLLDIKNIHFFSTELPLMHRGYIGVEFFFLVTGFLMAKTIYKSMETTQYRKISSEKLAQESLGFFWKKYRSIFTYHMIAFVILLCGNIIFKDLCKKGIVAVAEYIIESVPGFFLMQKLGLNYCNVNSIEWYISAMFIAIFLIYPICRRFYFMYSRIIGPFLGLYICCTLYFNYGTLTGASTWTGVVFVCVLRAIAEISLGITAFEIARVISMKKYAKHTLLILTIIEVSGYAVTVLYALSTLPTYLEVYALIALMISISLSFSNITYGTTLFNNKLFYWLGSMSMVLYLNQLFAIKLVQNYFSDCSTTFKLAGVLLLTALISILCKIASEWLMKQKIISKIFMTIE